MNFIQNPTNPIIFTSNFFFQYFLLCLRAAPLLPARFNIIILHKQRVDVMLGLEIVTIVFFILRKDLICCVQGFLGNAYEKHVPPAKVVHKLFNLCALSHSPRPPASFWVLKSPILKPFFCNIIGLGHGMKTQVIVHLLRRRSHDICAYAHIVHLLRRRSHAITMTTSSNNSRSL